MKILEKIKNHFWERMGLTGYSIVYLGTALIVLILLGANKYERWSCNNYKEITGFETKYIEFEYCYVKNSKGVFIRYDDKYKQPE